MAHEAPAVPAPAAPASGAAEPRGSSKFKLVIGGIVLAITAAECGVGWMYLPSASTVAAGEIDALESEGAADAGDSKHADGHGDSHARGHGAEKAGKHAKKTPKNRPPEQSEVDLGEFRVTAFQPLSNTTVRVDLHLYGTVAHGQEEDFTALFEAKKQRIRDQVIATIRSSDMADFTEAGLGLIKRRILETTNRTIGKPCLEAVLFSDFSFIEQ
ncbi:MAG TPA: flagellar basal body-associated FliL family protein [Pirellulales bacterium]|nr:flagellar basal body-associated FliL family protein [Pirellulales bacterium]